MYLIMAQSNEHTFALTSDHQPDGPQANLPIFQQHTDLVLGNFGRKLVETRTLIQAAVHLMLSSDRRKGYA